jgi:hypothetical protein
MLSCSDTRRVPNQEGFDKSLIRGSLRFGARHAAGSDPEHAGSKMELAGFESLAQTTHYELFNEIPVSKLRNTAVPI